jgi:hypothetical protein
VKPRAAARQTERIYDGVEEDSYKARVSIPESAVTHHICATWRKYLNMNIVP